VLAHFLDSVFWFLNFLCHCEEGNCSSPTKQSSYQVWDCFGQEQDRPRNDIILIKDLRDSEIFG
jgi:hypothetical protein